MTKKSKVRTAQPSGCLLVGFFGLFAAVGGVAFLLRDLETDRGNRRRSRMDGDGVRGALQSGRRQPFGQRRPTYSVEIQYEYEVEWQTYRGDRYNFSVGSRAAMTARLASSRPILRAPRSPLLRPGRSEPIRDQQAARALPLVWPLSGAVLAVGLGGLVFALMASRKKPQESRAGPWREPEPATDFADLRGPLELEPQISPVMKIVVPRSLPPSGTESSASLSSAR